MLDFPHTPHALVVVNARVIESSGGATPGASATSRVFCSAVSAQ